MKGLTVVLQADADPKVYDEGGVDVTNRCASITLLPIRRAEAVLFLHRDGHPYLEEGTGELAKETLPVVEISATGSWTARPAPPGIQQEA